MHGPILGVVTDNADPDNLGRVKVSVDLMGDSIETDWIPILIPSAGYFMLPEVEDQIVVAFMGDRTDSGIVIGGIWSDHQPPPETEENSGSDLNKDGENNLRFIKSRSGNQIILDDKDGEEKVQILAADGKTRFEFLVGDEMLNIETDKDMTLSAKGKLGIEAEEGEMKFQKALQIEADELSMKSKSKDITTKASQNLTLAGATVKLN